MKEFSKLQQAIYNIDFIAFHIKMTVDLGNKQGLSKADDKFLVERLMLYNLIQTCSFLDEYRLIERLAKDSEEIMNTTKILSPAIRRIRQYKGLKDFRNSILAHVNRDNSGNFRPYWRVMTDTSFPKTYSDVNLITNLIIGVASIIEKRHSKELYEIKQSMQKERLDSEFRLYDKSTLNSMDEFKKELENIVHQMGKIWYGIIEEQ